MAQFLYVLRPTRLAMLTEAPSDAEMDCLQRHFAHLQRLADEGRALLFGRTQENDERTVGLVVLEAEDEPAALDLMRQDPAVAEGVMTASLHPYQIAGGSLAP